MEKHDVSRVAHLRVQVERQALSFEEMTPNHALAPDARPAALAGFAPVKAVGMRQKATGVQ